MAIVGQPLLDIDVEGEDSDTSHPTESEIEDAEPSTSQTEHASQPKDQPQDYMENVVQPQSGGFKLAVPAVRSMLKEHNLRIEDVEGTGKSGRVLKEDVQRYLQSMDSESKPTSVPSMTLPTPIPDRTVSLSPTDSQMFKVMTQALSIPHFGYTHSVDLTTLGDLREKINGSELVADLHGSPSPKVTFLAIILKALSMAFSRHPKLNAHLDTNDPKKPQLILKGSHDFGIAVDSPNGLLVPVVKNVQTRSIFSIAAEIKRLSELAQAGKLSVADLKGASFNVSNVGSIGGNVVSPVILPPMVAIVAVGKIEDVVRPVIVQKRESILSRVVKRQSLAGVLIIGSLTGRLFARCAELVARILENIEHSGFLLK